MEPNSDPQNEFPTPLGAVSLDWEVFLPHPQSPLLCTWRRNNFEPKRRRGRKDRQAAGSEPELGPLVTPATSPLPGVSSRKATRPTPWTSSSAVSVPLSCDIESSHLEKPLQFQIGVALPPRICHRHLGPRPTPLDGLCGQPRPRAHKECGGGWGSSSNGAVPPVPSPPRPDPLAQHFSRCGPQTPRVP